MKTDSQYSVQQLSIVLASVLCDQFSQARLVKVWTHEAFFFVDVVLDTDWEESFLPFVEELMKKAIERRKPFEELEMSVAGAAALFAAHGQDLLVCQLPAQKNALVQILRYADQAIPLSSFLDTTSGGEFFALVGAIEVGSFKEEAIYRIKGVLSADKIKKKDLNPYAMDDPTQLAMQLKLLKQVDEGWCYWPKGECARKALLGLWETLMLQEKFSFVSTPQGVSKNDARSHFLLLAESLKGEKSGDKLAQLCYLEHGQEIFDYGVLTPLCGFQDLFCRVVPEARLFETIISSLQLMRQIPKIFCFEMQAVLYASQSSFESSLLQKALVDEQYAIEPSASSQVSFELRLMDGEGYSWSGPTLEIMRAKSLPGSWIIIGSLVGSWERFLALVVQKNKALPFELIEEQVRIFLLHADLRAYADEVRDQLEKEGLRVHIDAQSVSLKERVHGAVKEGIPYLVVIGPKEKEWKKISWRTSNSEKEETMSVDEFVNMVKH